MLTDAEVPRFPSHGAIFGVEDAEVPGFPGHGGVSRGGDAQDPASLPQAGCRTSSSVGKCRRHSSESLRGTDIRWSRMARTTRVRVRAGSR